MSVAKVYVTLKKGILDPQGRAVKESLDSLGFSGVEEVRMGKYIEVKLRGADKNKLEKELTGMCEKLLANPIIEDYRYEME
jgi:phosphoribosylformylglycinamidine synthase PurS subunit